MFCCDLFQMYNFVYTAGDDGQEKMGKWKRRGRKEGGVQ